MERHRIGAGEEALLELARGQHWVFTHAQAQHSGCSPSLITRRKRSGLWVPVFGDVLKPRYCTTTPLTVAQAAVMAVGPPCALSHRSAGALYGLDGIEAPPEPEIITLATRRSEIPGLWIHRSRTLRRGDITRRRGIAVTTMERTLLDLAGVLSVPVLEDALDCAIRERWVSTRAFLKRINAGKRRGRSGIGDLAALLEVRVGGRVADSRRENMLRRLLEEAGLPQLTKQHTIRDENGTFVARVDLCYPEHKIVIEFDGFREHAGRKRWALDSWKQNRIEDLGWRVRRIVSEDLWDRPQEVVEMIRRLRETPPPDGPA